MVHALQQLRVDRDDADRDRSKIDLGERCVQCRRIAYTCEREGEDTVSGFVCMYCVMIIDGAFK